MKINGKPYRTIWVAADGWSVEVIDQTKLPHKLEIVALKSADDAAKAIKQMIVRGAIILIAVSFSLTTPLPGRSACRPSRRSTPAWK